MADSYEVGMLNVVLLDVQSGLEKMCCGEWRSEQAARGVKPRKVARRMFKDV